jgi:hypothetical protein
MPLNTSPFLFLSFRSSGKVICHHNNRWERHPVHPIQKNRTILSLYTRYLRNKTDAYVTIIALVLPWSIPLFLPLLLSLTAKPPWTSA